MCKKICIYCKQEKSVEEFPKHSLYKDKLDMRCRSCVRQHAKVRAALHKIAPPKPEVCDCCKTVPRKWCLDHDHNTNTIRGWICDRCNTGIGKLGDNIEGVEKALLYLKESYGRKT